MKKINGRSWVKLRRNLRNYRRGRAYWIKVPFKYLSSPLDGKGWQWALTPAQVHPKLRVEIIETECKFREVHLLTKKMLTFLAFPEKCCIKETNNER